MSFRGSIVCLAVFVVGGSIHRLRAETAGGEGPPLHVVKLALNESDVTRVPTHPSVTVFVQFPSPITDYSGRGFTEDPQRSAGEFVLRFIGGDNYFTLSPLTETARRTLHVVVSGKD